MYLLFALAYLCIACDIPPLIPCSSICNISISVSNSNSTFAIFRHACHANPGAWTKYAGSNSYISKHISLKFSNMSDSSNVSTCTYRS